LLLCTQENLERHGRHGSVIVVETINLALIPLDVNQMAQELRENDIGYFEGAVISKTPKDVLGFDNTQA